MDEHEDRVENLGGHIQQVGSAGRYCKKGTEEAKTK